MKAYIRLRSVWSGCDIDFGRKELNNIFSIMDEAKKEASYLTFEQQVRAKAKELNEGWTADLGDEMQTKYKIADKVKQEESVSEATTFLLVEIYETCKKHIMTNDPRKIEYGFNCESGCSASAHEKGIEHGENDLANIIMSMIQAYGDIMKVVG